MARGCAILGIVILLLACCGLVAAAAVHIGDEPNAVSLTAVAEPATTSVGNTVRITVTIENLDLDEVTLVGVGLDESLLDGGLVAGADPGFRGVEQRSYPLYGDWSEYRYNRVLQDGETVTIIFTLTAAQRGTFEGDVSAWLEADLLGVFPLDRAVREPVSFTVQ